MDMTAICSALGSKIRYDLIIALKNEAIPTCCNRIHITEYAVSVNE